MAATSGWKQPHLLKLNAYLLCIVLLSSSQGFDATLANGLQSLVHWEEFMDHPKGAMLGLVTFDYWIGMLVAFFATPSIANAWGRKKSIYLGTVICFAGFAVQAAAPNKSAFLAARVIIGFGSAFWGTSGPLLISEVSHPYYRGKLTAMYMSGFHIGASVAAWATFGTRTYDNDWSWRIPSILQALLPCIAMIGVFFCPESPRWLIFKDRHEEARQVLVEWHAGGDNSSELVSSELAEIEQYIALDKEAGQSTTYLDMLKTPGNRHRTLITVSLGLFGNWVGNGIVSYYLSMILDSVGITDTSQQLIINACLNMWNIIWAMVGALNVDRLGRRTLFLLSGGIMLVSFCLITALSGAFAETGKAPVGIAVIPFLFIFYGGYDIALTPLITSYPAEIWPYRLRSRGVTLQWIVGVSGASLNTFVNPIALDAIAWKYYFVYVFMLVVYCLTVYFFYPETRGYSLELIATIFDKDIETMEGQMPKVSVVSMTKVKAADMEDHE